MSPDNRFVAAGSSSGVVNIYERASLLAAGSATPRSGLLLLNLFEKYNRALYLYLDTLTNDAETLPSLFICSPEKAILNLTTSVAGLRFSPTSEMLAMHSELKESAVKLAHVPSMTVSIHLAFSREKKKLKNVF